MKDLIVVKSWGEDEEGYMLYKIWGDILYNYRMMNKLLFICLNLGNIKNEWVLM